MKRLYLLALFAFFLFASVGSYSAVFETSMLDAAMHNVAAERNANTNTNTNGNGKFLRANMDAELMYGFYNNIYSTFSVIQSGDKFTYQLNSNFQRSNDFGYENSSYNKAQIGFAGQVKLFDLWQMTPEIDIDNSSRGMFDNTTYSREEKDKIAIIIKNEYRPTPTKWNFNVGGVQYVHKLTPKVGDVVQTDFFKGVEEIEWENIVSPSNKFTVKHASEHYIYDEKNNDYASYMTNSFEAGFRLTEYFQFGAAGIVDWDNSIGWHPGGKVEFASAGLTAVAFDIGYEKRLEPFRPEEVYFQQNYVSPEETLDASKMQRVSAGISYESIYNRSLFITVDKIKFKLSGKYEEADNFPNFYPIDADDYASIITATPVSAKFMLVNSDLSFDCRFLDNRFKVSLNYQYENFFNNDVMIYRPEQQYDGTIRLYHAYGEIEWSNKYVSSVHTSSTTRNEKLSSGLIGSLQVQFKIAEALYLDFLFNNLYGAKYSFRQGYPEPGFTALGGLRIII